MEPLKAPPTHPLLTPTLTLEAAGRGGWGAIVEARLKVEGGWGGGIVEGQARGWLGGREWREDGSCDLSYIPTVWH